MKIIKEKYLTPGEARQLERMGFIVEQVKPMKVNDYGYLFVIMVKD